MTTPVYPENLPGVAEYQITPVPQLTVTELTRSARATHRITQVPAAFATVTWNFSGDQYLTFMNWWREELLDGHRWFKLILPSAAGFKPAIVRFLQHREVQTRGYRYWIVTASIEILKRNISPEVFEQYITSALYPIYDPELLQPNITINFGQLSPPVVIIDQLQAVLTLVEGSLNDALLTTGFTEVISPELTLIDGVLDNILFTGYVDEAVTSSITLLSGRLDNILISNEVPADGMQPSITILSGTLNDAI